MVESSHVFNPRRALFLFISRLYAGGFQQYCNHEICTTTLFFITNYWEDKRYCVTSCPNVLYVPLKLGLLRVSAARPMLISIRPQIWIWNFGPSPALAGVCWIGLKLPQAVVWERLPMNDSSSAFWMKYQWMVCHILGAREHYVQVPWKTMLIVHSYIIFTRIRYIRINVKFKYTNELNWTFSEVEWVALLHNPKRVQKIKLNWVWVGLGLKRGWKMMDWNIETRPVQVSTFSFRKGTEETNLLLIE